MLLYQASLALVILIRYFEIFQEKLNVLLSLALADEKTLRMFLEDYRHLINKIAVDSGAWSVAKGKSNLIIERVISLLKRWGSKSDHYYTYDPDFSEKGFKTNYPNQRMMERSGLTPTPVIHNFFDGEIDFYVKSGKYKELALGSSQTTKFEYLKHAVDRIKMGNPAISIHYLGGSRYDWLTKVPIASCDTSSWAKTGAYGHIKYWNPKKSGLNKTDRIYIGGFIKEEDEDQKDYVSYRDKDDVDKYLKNTFGLTYQDLLGYDSAFNMQLVNVRFYAELEKRINEERIRRGVPLE